MLICICSALLYSNRQAENSTKWRLIYSLQNCIFVNILFSSSRMFYRLYSCICIPLHFAACSVAAMFLCANANGSSESNLISILRFNVNRIPYMLFLYYRNESLIIHIYSRSFIIHLMPSIFFDKVFRIRIPSDCGLLPRLPNEW